MTKVYLLVVIVLVWVELLKVVTGDVQNVTESSPCSDHQHVFLAPGSPAAGADARACVSRFHRAGPALLRLTVTADGQETSAEKELPPGDGGCIDFGVPLVKNPEVDLQVNISYPDAACSWSRAVRVRARGGRVLLLRAERPRYRGGEVVRLRVFALRGGAPAQGSIDEVWLQPPGAAGAGAAEAGAARWRRVRTRLGVAQLSHALEPRAPHGRWTAVARTADGSQGSTEFWVGEYELPPFSLSVQHAPRVLRTAERMSWNVCVRYPWGESVEGVLLVRLRGPGGAGVRTAAALRTKRACHRHAVAAGRLGLGTSGGEGGVVIADFSFQEKDTNIWQNTTAVSRVVDARLELQFVSRHRTVVAPGLPYKLKVKATRWDGKPSANETLLVCRSPANETGEGAPEPEAPGAPAARDASCDEATTDAAGVARFVFTVPEDEEYPFYRFQAFVKNESGLRSGALRLGVRRAGAAAAFGPLGGRSRAPGARALAPLYLRLGRVAGPVTVHFVVITRGGDIHRWGATTQCPQPADAQARTAGFDDHCTNLNRFTYKTDQTNLNNILFDSKSSRSRPTSKLGHHPKVNYHLNARIYENKMASADDKMAAESQQNGGKGLNVSTAESKLLRIMLPIRLSHQMCPDAHLIAYFKYGGELVSASKHFDFDECFANKVRLSWESPQVAPGAAAALHVQTAGPALCALTAVDTAARGPGAPGVREALVDAFRRHSAVSRNATVFDVMGHCFMDEGLLPKTSEEYLVQSLAEAGVRTAAAPRACAGPAPLADDPPSERSHFEEAWLWRLVAVANGSATVAAAAPDAVTRYAASAVCAGRRGLAVSQPAVLQVFREFFIHADGPRRLRRGDSAVVQYRIFNYLYQPLAVEVQLLTDARLQPLGPVSQVLCLGARAAAARRAGVLARAPGHARLSLRAQRTRQDACGNGTGVGSGVSDEVIIPVTIEYEGIPQEEHRSILLCGQDAAESSESSVSWVWGRAAAVPGSEALRVWLAADANAPLFTNADELVPLPQGCGEQNLARLAVSLLALAHADPLSAVALTARDNVARGYARQLQFLHPDGGFSAFGPSDGAPSTWLTAFALKYMRRAFKVLHPSAPDPLAASERWLLGRHTEGGCFRNEGQVFHREMKGGLGEQGSAASVALTAYVMTSLLDAGVAPRLLDSCLVCLRALPTVKKASNRIYAQALVTYALMRAHSLDDDQRRSNDVRPRGRGGQPGLLQDEGPRQLLQLLQAARRSGDLLWLETDTLPTSIEATGYLLLALCRCGRALRVSCAADARAARRWLEAQRNGRGGFMSTQDTLVALEALAAWSAIQPPPPVHLNVTSKCGAAVKTQTLTPVIAKVPVVMDMEMCEEFNVDVQGTGCVLVQATRSYHADPAAPAPAPGAPAPAPAGALALQVAVTTEGTSRCDAEGAFCVCAAVLEPCVVWSGSFPEMALLEMSLPGGWSADLTGLYRQMENDSLLRRVETSQNGGRVTIYLGSRDGSNMAGASGHVCYKISVNGPATRTKPAYVRVTDYYNPAVNDSQMYTIPESCPSRLYQEKDNYNETDNLFGSARSASGGEILMDYEFSYENVPEGIPIDYPYFYNLNDADERIGKNADVDYLNLSEDEENDATDEISNTDVPDRTVNFTKTSDTDFEGQTFRPNDKKDENANENEIIETNDSTKSDIKEEIVENLELSNSHVTETSDFNFGENYFALNAKKDKKMNESEVIDVNKTTKNYIKEAMVDNPKLSDFHVIDDDKDLDVPDGVEGPIVAVALPPDNFVTPPNPGGARRFSNHTKYPQHYYYPYPLEGNVIRGG